jgi:hypothetical protein
MIGSIAPPSTMSVPRPAMLVAMVTALRTSRLRDDLGLARVLLCVQHFVRQVGLDEMTRKHLGVLDRRRADQDRLPAFVAILDVRDDRVDLLRERPVHLVVLVLAHHVHVRRDHDGLEMVDLLELERFGVRRARHAGQLAVHPEVVLERDRRERLVLALDRHAFLRLHRLVQAVRPPPSGHQPAGELVDDHDLAVLHDVMLVAMEERVRAERRVEVMHEPDVVRVVEARPGGEQARARQDLLGVFVALLRQEHLVRLLVDPVVALALLLRLPHELRREVVQAVVEVDVVVGLSRDDERRARLVDEDGVHLVDDRVVEAALHALRRLEHHVVAQVVEAELVVGAVGNVRRVRRLLGRVFHLRQVDAHRHPEEAVDASHPVRVALREVVVDGDEVDAAAGERVEIDRQRGHERLALARAHFRDLAVVERHAADQLDVEMTHLQHALARLAHDGKRLRQERVERLAVRRAAFELRGLRLQLPIGQRADAGLQRVDLADDGAILLQ